MFIKNTFYFYLSVLFFFLIIQKEGISQDFFGQTSYPDGQNGQTMAVDQNNNLYIGVWGKGILKSTNQGNSFTLMNNGLTNFLIKDITVSANGKIFITTFGGGVFRSDNGGSSWISINTGLRTLLTTTVKVFPTGLVVLGTYGCGVYTSTNDGASWTETNTGLPYRAISAIEFTRNGYILLGTYGGGIFQSRDTAKTWRKSSSGLGNYFVHKFTRDAVGDVWVATNGKGIFSSPNDGISWGKYDTTGINDLNVTCLVITESNEPIIGTRNGGIQYWDKDLYRTWRTPFQPIMGVTALTKGNNGRIYAVGTNTELYVTTNNGRNWTQLASYKDNGNISVFAINNGVVFGQFNSKNFRFSSDYGNTWSLTNLPDSKVNSIIKTNSGTYFLGCQKGLYTSTDGINWAQHSRFKDTVVEALAYRDGFLIASVTYYPPPPNPPATPGNPVPSIHTSIDDGSSFTQKTYPTNGPLTNKLLIALNGNIYARMNEMIYKSTNNASTWTTLTISGFGNLTVNDINVDAINANFVYVATNKGLFKSQDGGNNWLYTKLSYLSQDTLNCRVVNVSDDGRINVIASFTLDIFATSGLWYSTDSGFSWDSLNTNVTSADYIFLSSDGESNLFMASNAIHRHFNPANMPVPVTIGPADGTKGLDLKPSFSWHPANKADMYEVQLSDDPTFLYVQDYLISSDTVFTVSNSLLYNTTYYWRVRSKTDGSYSQWSDVAMFSTLLNAPKLIDPPDNSTGVSLVPTFKWESVANATIYEFILAYDKEFTNIVFTADSLKDTLLISQTLLADKTFYWKVKAKNDNSVSPWSEIWSFKTTFGPPSLISPKNDSINIDINTKLTWGKVLNATFYNVLLSKDPNFTSAQPVKVTGAQELQLSNLDYDTKYYWKVNTGSNQGESIYSNSWNFTTLVQPVTLNSPQNNALNVPVNSSLSWTKAGNYTSYQIIIAKDDQFTKIIKDTIITGLQLNNLNFEGYKEYFWKVRVNQAPKLGYWSEVWNFKTYLNKTGLRYPDNHQTNLPSTISFIWFPTDGADYYFLQIARDANFNDLIFSQDSLQSTTKEVTDLSFATKFYWRVRSSNKDGFSDWSDVWDFQTGSVVPVLLRPANNSVDLPVPLIFDWKPVTEALTYFLQISKNETFTNLVYSNDSVTKTSIELDGSILHSLEQYFWRVKAKLTGIETDWSSVWVFRMREVSVKEYVEDNSILSVSPNPANDFAKVVFAPKNIGFAKIAIYNIKGELVQNLFSGYLSDKTLLELNTNSFNSGNYFIISEINGIYYIAKLQINK